MNDVSIFVFGRVHVMRQAGIVNMAELIKKQLASELSKMSSEEAFTLARAFSHYLTMI